MPKKTLSCWSPSSYANLVTGSSNKPRRKLRTKMVVPKGRKIIKPVKNAFLNFLERLFGLRTQELSLFSFTFWSEQKIRPKPKILHKVEDLPFLPAHDFSVFSLLVVESNEVQPAMNQVKGKFLARTQARGLRPPRSPDPRRRKSPQPYLRQDQRGK